MDQNRGMNTEPDGKEVVRDWLCRPAGQLVGQSRSPSGWTSGVRLGGGAEADHSTIRFLKSLRSSSTELHAIEFTTVAGEGRTSVVGVRRDSAGMLNVIGGAGGGGSDPPRDRPWVNLGAWGWPGGFSGGGRVIGAGRDAASRVRLIFKNGVALEDTVRARWVLFTTEEMVQPPPMRVEIFNPGGELLSSHTWP